MAFIRNGGLDRIHISTGIIVITVIMLLGVSPSANGAFERPFIRQITRTGTSSGLSCASENPRNVTCFATGSPGGVVIGASGNLWVGNGEQALSEFDPSGAPITTVSLKFPTPEHEAASVSPEHLAYNAATGNIYDVATAARKSFAFSPHVEVFDTTGSLVEQWKPAFGRPSGVAVDNSTDPFDPAAGSVYVAHTDTNPSSPNGNGHQPGIEKFTVNGGFLAEFGPPTSSLAIDTEGNVYGLDNFLNADQINEYSPAGVLIRSFDGQETPGLGEDHQDNHGFGGEPVGLTFDPVSGHILVSVRNYFNNEAAVDEFDGSGHFLEQVTENEIEKPLATRKVSHLKSAYDMTVDSIGDLYVVDRASNETDEAAIDVYGPGKFFPNLKLLQATKREPTSAVLNGSVNPEGQSLDECYFEYVTEAAYLHNQATHAGNGFADTSSGGQAECEPSAGTIAPNSIDNAVKSEIKGLTAGTTYRYRLTATTSGSLGGRSASAVLAFTAPAPPVIVSVSTTNLSSLFADLRATINPVGADTSYQFEYVDDAHYAPENPDPYSAGHVVPSSPVDIGQGGAAGNVAAKVLQEIGDLTPDTTYHFRVIATNAMGAVSGIGGGQGDETFTTLPQVVPGLPDHRSYELVTPANKGGASDMFGTAKVFTNADVGYSSASGDEFLLTNTLANFGAFGASEKDAYVFRRDSAANEWRYTSLVSSTLGVQSVGGIVSDPSAFNGELAFNVILGSFASREGASVASLIGNAGGPYLTLHKDQPVNQEPEDLERSELAAGSTDVSHAILESKNHTLAPGDTSQDPATSALYERTKVGTGGCNENTPAFLPGTGGCLELVNGDGEGSLVSGCGAVLGQGHGPGATHNAVSADGSRVIFTAPDPYIMYNTESSVSIKATKECWNGLSKDTPQIYMRLGASIIKLSAPEQGWIPLGLAKPAVFVGASKDDSKVFFLSEAELTKDDAANGDAELYECEISFEGENPVCAIRRISSGETGTAAGAVWTVPAISENGGAVYFTAFGKLVDGLSSLGAGQVYLYRYDTLTHTTAYVATVDESDYVTGLTSSEKWFRELALSVDANWYTTPDGNYLLFATGNEIGGYRTLEAEPGDCPFQASGGGSGLVGHCAEVYRYHYDAAAPSSRDLICVSCNSTGTEPVSNAQFASRSAPTDRSGGPMRAMSDDGSYVFFDTADGLVPQDQDHTLDVYEWHEDGATKKHSVSLISSGQDLAPSFFLGTSASGGDVFFGSHARLVAQDTDSAGDLYDARICGTSTSGACFIQPSAERAQCEGDACHGVVVTPIDQTPSSITFSGPGNAAADASKQTTTTLSQRLGKALALCRKQRKARRRECEKKARRRYGKKQSKVRASYRGRRKS